MFYPIVSQKDVFVDNNKQILTKAKIEFYDPVSLTHIDVFTYNENVDGNFVVAENPIYLNMYGRPQQTYFTKQLTFCRLFKYIGNFSDPRLDDDTSNWQFVREWLGNSVSEDIKTDTNVFTIAALKDIDPSVEKVFVVGYRTFDDCEGRVYVWDATSNDYADGGYVIASNTTSNGRWILKFDGEYIPSSYYGVYPGDETNLNALLGYADSVGTDAKKTAPGIYFIPGNYNQFNGSLVTTKRILVDANTQFLASDITCSDVKVIGTPNQAITDFYFQTGNNLNADTVANSSWYKTVMGFWRCGARTLVMSRKQNFTNKTININITVSNARIVNNFGAPFSDIVFTNNAWLRLSSCTIEGEKLFSATTSYPSHLTFSNMEFTDRYFTSSGDHKLTFSNSLTDYKNVCILTIGSKPWCNIEHFREPANYVRALAVMGETSIDLQNKYVSDEDFAAFGTIMNGRLANCSVGANNIVTQTLENCKIDGGLTVNCRDLRLVNTTANIKNCDTLQKLVLSKNSVVSTLNGVYPFNNKNCEVTCYDSVWNWRTELGDDNTSTHKTMKFVNSRISNVNMNVKDIDVDQCDILNATINIYPYYENSHFRYKLRIRNSYINNTNPITFEIKDPQVYVQAASSYCQNIIFQQLSLVNNFFEGNELGVKCSYWAVHDWRTLHICEYSQTDTTTRHNINCRDNNGNIPGGHDNYYYMGTHYRAGDPSAWYDWETDWADDTQSTATPYKIAFVKRRLFMIQGKEDRMATPFLNRSTYHGVDVPNCITRRTSDDGIINMTNPHYLSYAEFCENNRELTPPVSRDDYNVYDDYFAWLFAVRDNQYNAGYNYTVF